MTRTGDYRRFVHFDFVYSSACPCSAELAEHARDARGAYACPIPSGARRGSRPRGGRGQEDLDRGHPRPLPEGAQTETQVMVKREDEQAFAELNGANLKFVEDAARLLYRLSTPTADQGFPDRVLAPRVAALARRRERDLQGREGRLHGRFHGFPLAGLLGRRPIGKPWQRRSNPRRRYYRRVAGHRRRHSQGVRPEIQASGWRWSRGTRRTWPRSPAPARASGPMPRHLHVRRDDEAAVCGMEARSGGGSARSTCWSTTREVRGRAVPLHEVGRLRPDARGEPQEPVPRDPGVRAGDGAPAPRRHLQHGLHRGDHGLPGAPAYTAAKFGVAGLSKADAGRVQGQGGPRVLRPPGATVSPSWKGSGVPEGRMMPAEDVASAFVAIYRMTRRTVVEEIVLRPQLGDL
jgi:hypothetical protein